VLYFARSSESLLCGEKLREQQLFYYEEAFRVSEFMNFPGYRVRESLEEEVSSRQDCESSEVKVLVPPIACSRAGSMSDACEGNDARSARM